MSAPVPAYIIVFLAPAPAIRGLALTHKKEKKERKKKDEGKEKGKIVVKFQGMLCSDKVYLKQYYKMI